MRPARVWLERGHITPCSVRPQTGDSTMTRDCDAQNPVQRANPLSMSLEFRWDPFCRLTTRKPDGQQTFTLIHDTAGGTGLASFPSVQHREYIPTVCPDPHTISTPHLPIVTLAAWFSYVTWQMW